MDKLTRRGFVLAGLGVAMAGCASGGGTALGGLRPGAPWPGESPRPTPGSATHAGAAPGIKENDSTAGPLDAIARSQWAKAPPMTERLNPLNGVNRITVHHEGWSTVGFTDYRTTAERLEAIRVSHLDRLVAGDIGYHYVIDRAGRVWHGRDLQYQGAHVKNQNEHNLGIMVMGNFNEQSPSSQQLATLRESLVTLMRHYDVPRGRVYTHQELGPTTCPGTALQSHMVTLRRSGLA